MMSNTHSLGLPEPSSEEQAHSDVIRQSIVETIDEAGGYITFSRFMELALYSAKGGYYVSRLRKFGEQGDFITAPDLGNLFARCLARQIAEGLDALGLDEVLELGAGSGKLAMQLLRALFDLGCLPRRYAILEISAELKRRQLGLLRKEVPQYLDRIVWLDELPAQVDAVVIANEVVDALPVERFRIEHEQVRGLGVGVEDGRFVDVSYIVKGANWERIHRLELTEGYQSEAGFQGQAWMRTLSERLHCGQIMIIDYGFPAHEYFHPQRRSGTLTCHYRHRVHADPYIYVGLQDITAHVDFTGLARCAVDSGLSLLGFTTKASFLLSLGILDIVEPDMLGNTTDAIKLSQQVKKLTLPSEMGELFKVMIVGTQSGQVLTGFRQADHQGRL